ncbi:hypothetical protein EHQ43_14810 [Leptospira bouyouniensis]|uniref:Uncharacterized protein n=1 Tax=Leptospira bouyouniensis TaxID=2484911 RepID=A0A7I0HN32_9LEPT|nr:hypothetical protein [Leptospira bouyouniensis]TGL03072.1 hypothetical protein EHQ43_14810 [Leptospira bouyouniensis]
MKFKVSLLIVLACISFCKEKPIANEKYEDPFFVSDEKECFLEPELNSKCISKREELSCHKILMDLLDSKLENIMFNKLWIGEDQQTTFYNIDSNGMFEIFEGGPDKEPNQRIQIGKGKLFLQKKQWFYEQTCKDNLCSSFKIPIVYLHCTITKSMNESEIRLKLDFGNREFIPRDEIENDKNYKLITFIQEKPVPNQIFNGFTSTKVPPIPSN